MTTTLGELYDAAIRDLRAAVAALPDTLTPDQIRTRAHQLAELSRQLGNSPVRYLDDPTRTAPPQAAVLAAETADLRGNLRAARDRLRPLATGTTRTEDASPELATASARVTAARDLLRSHRAPDGHPVTPYAALLAGADAQRYVVARLADLAWEAGRYSDALASAAPEHTGAALFAARAAFDRAAVMSRYAMPAVAGEIAALPLAPAPTTAPAPGRTEPRHALGLVTAATERLTRAAFESTRGTPPTVSGADLQESARALSLSLLLSGRVLLHCADAQPDAIAAELRTGAARLRTAARAWHEAGRGWGRIVDTADPRLRPRLPAYPYDMKRAGRATEMPRTHPHPIVTDAQAVTLYIGRLLYGAEWQPGQGGDRARPVGDLLFDAAGLGELAATLYRLPAAAGQLAEAGPRVLSQIRAGLVTDDPEHRPAGQPHHVRWYPATARQVDALTEGYPEAARSAYAAADQLAAVAHTAGADTTRARLDAAIRYRILTGTFTSSSTPSPEERLQAALAVYRQAESAQAARQTDAAAQAATATSPSAQAPRPAPNTARKPEAPSRRHHPAEGPERGHGRQR